MIDLGRQLEKLERQLHIMDAAERVFLERGVGSATMDQIAHEARVSKGALYLTFKNKDELFLAITTRALRELIETWQTVKDSDSYQTGFELYEMTLVSFVQYALEHRDRFQVAFGWSASQYTLRQDSPAFSEYQSLIQAASYYGYEALEQGKRDGSVRADLDSTITSFHVWGGTVGMLMLIYNAAETNRRLPYPVDLYAALAEHLSALLASLQQPTSPQPFRHRLRAALGVDAAER